MILFGMMIIAIIHVNSSIVITVIVILLLSYLFFTTTVSVIIIIIIIFNTNHSTDEQMKIEHYVHRLYNRVEKYLSLKRGNKILYDLLFYFFVFLFSFFFPFYSFFTILLLLSDKRPCLSLGCLFTIDHATFGKCTRG